MAAQLSGVDKSKPIVRFKFDSRGFEDIAGTVPDGVVTGTTNVYRAIGSEEDGVGNRVYSDVDIPILKMWHVVLIGSLSLHA